MAGMRYKDTLSQILYGLLCSEMLLFIIPGTAQAQAQSLPTHHTRPPVISGQAQFMYGLPQFQTLPINFLLPVRDQAGLDQFLQDLYDPSSPSYGHFLTPAEFTARFAPTQEDYDAVVAFARANGMTVTNLAPNRLVISVTAAVVSIEAAFHVKMGVYQHPTESRTFFAPDREPTVDLRVPLWHIGGLDNFSTPRPLYTEGVQGNTTGSGPGGSFLGSDRRAAYYGGSLTGSGQSVGLFQLDGYNLNDVQAYFNNAGQSLNVPINNVLVDGASSGSDGNDTEQVIDIIEAASMAPGLSQVRVYIGPRASFSDGVTDVDIFNYIATEDIAKQLSCSWTWRPADPGNLSQPGTNDYIFAEMATQGQNLFVASGDYGSYPNASGFYYPAEDANIVAVGGTNLTTNGPGGTWASETAWAGSGGGISPDGIAIPSWQQLTGVITSRNGGSTVYRNIPDVAAEANTDNYYCANNTCGQNLGGTSLAAPTWAGYMALVNQQEQASYGNSVGFLNPLIYPIGVGSGYAAAFHDIASGSNGTYSAVPGYDLVTGWGSPNGSGLINALAGVGHTYGTGWASVSGSLRSCWNGHLYVPDRGTATITVNNHPDTVGWGTSSTASSVASGLGQLINADGNAFVTASVAGTTVNLTSKVKGSGGNYSLSVSSVSQNQSCGGGTSFPLTASGSFLTGGH